MITRIKTRMGLLCAISLLFLAAPASFSQNCLLRPPQMISWWSGDGNANDIQGSNPGTLQGSVNFAAGMVGQAFSFNGVDSYVSVPDSTSLQIKTALTVDAWVKPSNPVTNGRQFIAGKTGRYGIEILNDGRVNFYLEIIVSADNQVASVHSLQANVFTHVTGTYDPATGLQKIYLNGVLDNSRTTSGTPKGSPGAFQIGGEASAVLFYLFSGLIDDVHLFSRALTSDEIMAIYNTGSAGLCNGNNSGGDNSALFVPIVLSASGANGSFFTSEIALTNRGASTATLNYTYTAAIGSGSGTASDTLLAGRQRIVPDGINYLRSLGVPIPAAGSQGGTLRVSCNGVSLSDLAVTVRTATAVTNGRAGLAYAGIPVSMALTESSYLCGLRQTATDRSNIALQNAGTVGDIVLGVTVYSGDPANQLSQDLPNVTLGPGGFAQISGILQSNGLSLVNGFVRVSRVSGTSPYYAYAVINDNANSDGSFIPPLLENSVQDHPGQTLPVIVETSSFSSELVVTNLSASSANTYHFAFVSDAIPSADNTANFDLTLNPREQQILPNLVQYLRDHGIAGIPPVGTAIVGALFVTGDTGSLFMGARTSTPGGGGRFGLFYVAVPNGLTSMTGAWVYGLQQNADNRSNLALVNTGATDASPATFSIELYNGDTGLKASTLDGITLNARHWMQIGLILNQSTFSIPQGYAHIVRSSGSNPTIVYGVINDGGQPGQRTGDGAYINSSP